MVTFNLTTLEKKNGKLIIKQTVRPSRFRLELCKRGRMCEGAGCPCNPWLHDDGEAKQ